MIPYIKREKQPLVVLAIDIDKFKTINDTHGHHTGDVVLVEVTKTISHILRKSDIFGRIGGEEFAILLPNTSIDGAKLVAEKMRETIESLKLFSGENIPIPVTISIGISDMNYNDNCTEDILLRADEALYKAKGNGRNQVVCG
jgi:diguanylate cyclase (GGDEF)-like protein